MRCNQTNRMICNQTNRDILNCKSLNRIIFVITDSKVYHSKVDSKILFFELNNSKSNIAENQRIDYVKIYLFSQVFLRNSAGFIPVCL